MLEAVMGFEGGNHPVFDQDFQGEWNIKDEIPPDDPFEQRQARRSLAKAVKNGKEDWQGHEN